MRSIRNRYLLLLDAILVTIAPIVAYALRFEGWTWPAEHQATAVRFIGLAVPVQLAIFHRFGLYRRLWRFASVRELERIFVAGLCAALAAALLGGLALPLSHLSAIRVPILVLFTSGLLGIALIATPRLLIRMSGPRANYRRRQSDSFRRVLIAGAGAAGEMVLRELRANHELEMQPVGFVDDDPLKRGLQLSDLPIFGVTAEIPRIVERERIDEIFIAMPGAAGQTVRRIVRHAFDAGVKTRTVPGIFEILSGRVSVSAFREVQIEDLLRREPVQADLAAVSTLATGRTVLVTGAGGSIGSELCRQLLALGPSKLVILGHGENPIFDILNELRSKNPAVPVTPVIADIRDRERIRHVFEQHRPFAIFHAAAHKHVPLMEENAIEAVTNNVIGTKNVVDAAVACGTEHLVLISTDKAVRPPNVMGATKRIAEYVVHNAAVRHRRNFVAVRFGNVLGSQGSVVPTFVKQIKAGGPVTVTHPDMRRYFMTIPEAVQLVLQAGALGKGGELFMLDMGEPVRIVDLARDMIRLCGLEEGADIEIKFTGMRPGEKLYEEMFFSHEVAEPTEHPKILRARNGHQGDGEDELIAKLIDVARSTGDERQLRKLLMELVPDFTNGRARPAPETTEQPFRPDAEPQPARRAAALAQAEAAS
jgi:FlaA1/EpsC-like NDP-sugar epimerase